MLETRWVFVVKVQDRPGVLASVSSVFSSRGVSLSMVLVSRPAWDETALPIMVLSFQARPRAMETLRRTLGRLSRVREVSVFPYDSPRLRSIAVLRLAGDQTPPLPDDVHAELLALEPGRAAILLMGSPPAVDAAIERVYAQAAVAELTVTILSA